MKLSPTVAIMRNYTAKNNKNKKKVVKPCPSFPLGKQIGIMIMLKKLQ